MGDTIFNILKVNDFEVDENDRPIYPPTILSTKIIENPFPEIVPRKKSSGEQPVKEEKKEKPKKNFALLSFGEEAAEEQEGLDSIEVRMKSSYHYSEDPEER